MLPSSHPTTAGPPAGKGAVRYKELAFGVVELRIQEAVARRIEELANERGITLNNLAERAGVSPAALKWTVRDYPGAKRGKVKNTGVVTIKKICQGLGMDFWQSPLFRNLEPEPEKND